jgi:hypothetical protein
MSEIKQESTTQSLNSQETNTSTTEETKTTSLDDDTLSGSISLMSKDGKDFSLEKRYAMISGVVCTALDGDSTATEVPMINIESRELKLIVEYMNHHKGKEPPIVAKPLKSKIMAEVVNDPWDATFIDSVNTDTKDPENVQDIKRLLMAVNWASIHSLLHLCSAKVASVIKGKPLEKMKKILDLDKETSDKADKRADEVNNLADVKIPEQKE